ncbi:MAG: hypothetical protein ACKVJW_07985 [Flavobacteriales bacterium]|jgi:hypothetical protein|tara:strand:+ start:131 stop:1453 length:1323 start_codon:yes stop_codon:yes gene_type:complete
MNKITKLVGLKKIDFDQFVKDGKITISKTRLIPLLKTGDEMALTSILLSAIRLIKEFKDSVFKELKLKRSGKAYYYSEVVFHDIDTTSRLDGMILVVVSGKIEDAIFIEVKNDKAKIEEEQILKYYKLAQLLNNVPKILTISNEFVFDSSHSPITIKNQSKKISLYHFSWTYIKTIAQLLLFDNENNIDDEDQINIMKEVMHYFNDERSGVNGFRLMSKGWKAVSEKIKSQQPLNDKNEIIEAITSWHQEENDMSLMLSRKLGVLVKSNIENPKSKLNRDIKRLKDKQFLSTSLRIKGAVSDLKVIVDFRRRTISMSVRVIPPLDKGTISRISSIKKQLSKCKDSSLLENLYIDADIKFSSKSIKYNYTNIDQFYEHDNIKNLNIIAFDIELIKTVKIDSTKIFVAEIEKMLLNYYNLIVQDLKSWKKSAPKLTKEEIKI